MLNVMACPGEVFDEIVAAPLNLANWRAPTLLVCFTGLLAVYSRMPAAASQGGWPLAAAILTAAATIAGSVWCAFVLWFIGRIFLNVRFSFLKTLEIAGLAGALIALGNLVTVLLIAATANPSAQPSLALLASDLSIHSAKGQILQLFNFFHLWSLALLALGLSRLANVSFKEASFWVFGYWFVIPLALIIAS
jgi:hypothetical protein